ncbi:ABC transporter [Photobacterium aquae]|uniref:ABC transporter n=1 Tax=Photobacterium aquae TaxID=1195763 RepID=A0A0J1JUQ6_9GAMM|nr:ABC transporter [Photobacterium aquae]
METSDESVAGGVQSGTSEQAETVALAVTAQSGDSGDETDAELLAEIEAEVDEQGDYPVPGVYDPFENFNRVMWSINYDYLDPYIARPVSIAYMDYVPSFVRTGIKNFLANLDEPASMINSAVMLEGEQAVAHFNRFWINSTFGVAGLIDIASAADIRKPNDREFGDTMGRYGVPNGPYFMVPMYGPITLREGAGDMVDDLYFPLDLLTFWQSLGKWAFEGMESRAALVPQEALLKDSPDPYIFTRDAYIQNKNFSATGGVVSEDTVEEDTYLDDYLDEIDAE